eukprot:1137727-Pelagomonas_calceolata.AAC.1
MWKLHLGRVDVLLCAIGVHADKLKMILPTCRYEGACALREYFELFQTLSFDFSLAQPFLRQQLSVQAVFDFLLQHNNKLFFSVSELLDLLSAGMDQPQADQPNSLAEGLLV